jgi:CubicO group peptidase (beta-lactamase class C family)
VKAGARRRSTGPRRARVRSQLLNSPGSYNWGGAASTVFLVDPTEELVVLLMAQLTPSSTYPLRQQLQVLTYRALTA